MFEQLPLEFKKAKKHTKPCFLNKAPQEKYNKISGYIEQDHKYMIVFLSAFVYK